MYISNITDMLYLYFLLKSCIYPLLLNYKFFCLDLSKKKYPNSNGLQSGWYWLLRVDGNIQGINKYTSTLFSCICLGVDKGLRSLWRCQWYKMFGGSCPKETQEIHHQWLNHQNTSDCIPGAPTYSISCSTIAELFVMMCKKLLPLCNFILKIILRSQSP